VSHWFAGWSGERREPQREIDSVLRTDSLVVACDRDQAVTSGELVGDRHHVKGTGRRRVRDSAELAQGEEVIAALRSSSRDVRRSSSE
jgi:hypothetical protein